MTTLKEGTEEVPVQKIYKIQAIRGGTFLGGPLVAGYFIAGNFKAFNEHEKAKKAWLFAILATVVIFGAVFLIPDSVNVPKYIIPLVYSWIAYYLVQKYQGSQIDAHLGAGGQAYNWWRVLAVGLIGTVVTLIPIVILVLIFGQ